MKTIKFSSDYPKLWGQTSAELIDVRYIKIDSHTPEALLNYDTTKADGSRFPLKPGNYIQLVFVGNLNIPFCTIRAAYPHSKTVYYLESIGEQFQIEIKEA